MVKAIENTSYFSFTPNAGQLKAFDMLCHFFDQNNSNDFFILTGAAGSGKTSVVSAVTKYLHDKSFASIIAAPTGRAANVISNKTNRKAKTIHSLIYVPDVNMEAGMVVYNRKENKSKDYTIFIIDEASMIPDNRDVQGLFTAPGGLLADLIAYVKQGSKANKIVFIGDAYQLAPVTSPGFSPALCANNLIINHGLKGDGCELTQIERQRNGSYILDNAALLRNAVRDGLLPPADWRRRNMGSITAISRHFGLHFYPYDQDRITMVTGSNRDAQWWNRNLRPYIMNVTDELQCMDAVVFNRNWFSDEINLYNGSSAIVHSIDWTSKQHFADLTFVDVELNVTKSLEKPQIVRAKMILEVLLSEKGELPIYAEKKLFSEAMKTNKKFRESKNFKDDPYLSAMRLRFGYALTCHKAQGGEWDNVIVHPFCNRDARTLYTAVTRARKELISYHSR